MKTADTSKTNNQASTDYVAPELKDFTVLGVPFQAFIDEDGQAVFSEIGVERGLGLYRGYVHNHRSKYTKRLELSHSKVSLKATQECGLQPSKPRNESQQDFQALGMLKTNAFNNLIRVVPKAELVQLVQYLANKGNATAIAMQQASFATILQMELDRRSGIERTNAEYLEPAAKMMDAVKSMMTEALSEMKAEVKKLQVSSDKYNNIKAATSHTFKGLDRMLDSLSDQPALPPADDNYTVAGYLKKKGVVLSRQELVKFSMDVAGAYRTITGKEPKKIKSVNSVNVYSTAELPILDMALAKHLGL